MMKPLCIYHGNNCADGFASAMVVHMHYGDKAEYMSANYGDPAPDVTNRVVFIVDFSYPKEDMIKMRDQAIIVIVLDHHKTAEDDLQPLLDEKNPKLIGRFDKQHSGCMLTWDKFFPNTRMPRLLEYIGSRDLWQLERYPHIPETHLAIMSYEFDFDVWEGLMAAFEMKPDELINEGKALLRKHVKDCAIVAETNTRMVNIKGHVVPSCNAPKFMASDIGHLLCKQYSTAPFAIVYFHRADGQTEYSLRSIGDFDVSALCQLYGGGGHHNAAGFKIRRGSF